LAATAYAGEEGELAVGEGEDAGAVLEGGGGGADVDVVGVGWWHFFFSLVICSAVVGWVR